MTERGIGRSALLVGLLVLAVLVGGRITGTLHARQTNHLVTKPANGGVSTSQNPSTSKPSPKPEPSPTRTSPGHGVMGRKDDNQSRPPKNRPPYHGRYGALYSTGSSAVALTFDDGPSPDWTPKVLDLLREQGVKATFCLVGVEVRRHPELVARIVREGHTLCNHSWQHDLKLGSRPDADIRSDLARTNAEIRQTVPGAKIAYYRQPGGKWTPAVVKVAKGLGMASLGWAVDPQDWARPGAPAIIKRVMDNTQAGSIVLMHDGGGDRSQSLAACETLIPWLKQRFPLIAMR